ncbi:hypothetical protein [Halostagnicola sp. A56]|uniref:hypothetical protein n=1 Tax=Halostagnicola sp. A56 TaxID=1495067 RepID=UPI0012E17F48|nr:hypothetical protein [Halostagnicola sp. A56]
MVDIIDRLDLSDLKSNDGLSEILWWDNGLFKLWDIGPRTNLYYRFEDYNGPDQYIQVIPSNTTETGIWRLQPDDLPWSCEEKEVVTTDSEKKYHVLYANDYGDNNSKKLLAAALQMRNVDIEEYEWTPPTPPTPPKRPADARFDHHNPQNHR